MRDYQISFGFGPLEGDDLGTLGVADDGAVPVFCTPASTTIIIMSLLGFQIENMVRTTEPDCEQTLAPRATG